MKNKCICKSEAFNLAAASDFSIAKKFSRCFIYPSESTLGFRHFEKEFCILHFLIGKRIFPQRDFSNFKRCNFEHRTSLKTKSLCEITQTFLRLLLLEKLLWKSDYCLLRQHCTNLLPFSSFCFSKFASASALWQLLQQRKFDFSHQIVTWKSCRSLFFPNFHTRPGKKTRYFSRVS